MANPGFGKVFTDHMVVARYIGRSRLARRADPGPRGHPARSRRRGPALRAGDLRGPRRLTAPPTAARPCSGRRPMRCRFRRSAERMAMAPFPEDAFVEAVRKLVEIDRDLDPRHAGRQPLSPRPFMIASEAFLGVKPASEYLFVTIASAVGSYFKDPTGTVTVWISEHFTRAAPGGTGAGEVRRQLRRRASRRSRKPASQGCEQVVFLDAAERRYVEELGGMNVFFVFEDGTLVTPPLSDSILPGITRDSVITLAREAGLTVREEPYTIDAWRTDVRQGRLTEAFACGTAAVITPIGTVKGREESFTIGNGKAGPVAQRLRSLLVDIQRGKAKDAHGWFQKVF
ncbi:branched-chain amino acid aminotransferase [Methylobacterium oryzae CBMB20]